MLALSFCIACKVERLLTTWLAGLSFRFGDLYLLLSELLARLSKLGFLARMPHGLPQLLICLLLILTLGCIYNDSVLILFCY